MGIVKWCAWEVAPKTPYYKSTSECSCIFHTNWQDFYGLLGSIWQNFERTFVLHYVIMQSSRWPEAEQLI